MLDIAFLYDRNCLRQRRVRWRYKVVEIGANNIVHYLTQMNGVNSRHITSVRDVSRVRPLAPHGQR